MSISGGSAASSMIQLSALRINRNSPSPGQWTLVREYNIEKRDPYSEWTYNVNSRLLRLKQQLLSYMDTLKTLDEEIEEETIKLASLKEVAIPISSVQSTPSPTPHNSNSKKTDKKTSST